MQGWAGWMAAGVWIPAFAGLTGAGGLRFGAASWLGKPTRARMGTRCRVIPAFRQPASRGVAQPGSALDWGSRGRRFKSGLPDHRREQRFCLVSPMYRPRTVVPGDHSGFCSHTVSVTADLATG